MKRVILPFLVVFFAFTVAIAQEATTQEAEKKDGPKIEFEETEYNFGEITQGEKVSKVFTFKNTGTEPLVLSNVKTTCGCTATSWPRDPIAPGQTAEINATFNSAGKQGMQTKPITISSNAVNPRAVVYIKGTVVRPTPQAN